jgi:hypothetical protein
MRIILKTLLILFIIVLASELAYADSLLVQNPDNGHGYKRFDSEKTWSEARAYCDSIYGHLATITTANENNFVFSQIGIAGIDIWLGGTDENSEGNWEWITGEPWSYTNWAAGQPDNCCGGQDYLDFWANAVGQWDDNGLPLWDPEFAFICEWETQQWTCNGMLCYIPCDPTGIGCPSSYCNIYVPGILDEIHVGQITYLPCDGLCPQSSCVVFVPTIPVLAF